MNNFSEKNPSDDRTYRIIRLSSQSHARAILFLMSDTLPSLKFPSFIFPSERLVLMKSLPLSGSIRINSTAFEAKAARPFY